MLLIDDDKVFGVALILTAPLFFFQPLLM